MPKPEKIILVCSNRRPPGHPKGDCADKGAGDLLLAFREEREKRGLNGKIAVTGTGCLGPCHRGTIVAVMPDNVWYKGVSKEDAADIFTEHVEGDRPVERLLLTDMEWET